MASALGCIERRNLCLVEKDVPLKEDIRVEDAVRVLLAGCNLKVGPHRIEDLVRMASAAHEGDARLTVTARYRVEDMMKIASAGKGHITFDVSSS